jgi:hypothetical protein
MEVLEVYSVQQLRLHHGFHYLILSGQFVPVDSVRVDVQSGTDVGMPQHGLYCFDVGFGLGDQVGCQGMAQSRNVVDLLPQVSLPSQPLDADNPAPLWNPCAASGRAA